MSLKTPIFFLLRTAPRDLFYPGQVGGYKERMQTEASQIQRGRRKREVVDQESEPEGTGMTKGTRSHHCNADEVPVNGR